MIVKNIPELILLKKKVMYKKVPVTFSDDEYSEVKKLCKSINLPEAIVLRMYNNSGKKCNMSIYQWLEKYEDYLSRK